MTTTATTAAHAAAFDSQFSGLLTLVTSASALLAGHPAMSTLDYARVQIEVLANDVDVALEQAGV